MLTFLPDADKLRYLYTILDCYTSLAKVSLYKGDVRDSSCFIVASLNMAKLLLLPVQYVYLTYTV